MSCYRPVGSTVACPLIFMSVCLRQGGLGHASVLCYILWAPVCECLGSKCWWAPSPLERCHFGLFVQIPRHILTLHFAFLHDADWYQNHFSCVTLINIIFWLYWCAELPYVPHAWARTVPNILTACRLCHTEVIYLLTILQHFYFNVAYCMVLDCFQFTKLN